MANTNMDLLYPEFWATSFDMLDMGEYQLQNLVSRSVENQIANQGTKVNVPLTPDFTAADWTPGNTITPTDISQEEIEVELDTSKSSVITLNGTELTKSGYDLISSYGVSMARAILASVNEEIYKEMIKSTSFIDATAGIDEDDVVDAGSTLSNSRVSRMDRKFVGSPDVIGALKKIDAFQKVNESGTSDIMRDGIIMRRMGFDFFENNAISKYTPADLAGAINNVAGYAVGATTVAVDGFDDDATPIRPGDIITFDSDSTSTKHTVVSTTTTSSDTTGITFSPGLVETLADNDGVTVTATQSALAFASSGLAFAARVYATLPTNTGVQQFVTNVQGLPVRISVWHDGKLGVVVQYDILFGQKIVVPDSGNRIVRIIEDL